VQDLAEIAAIETAAFLAWPAAEIEACGGWRLRATRAVTRRANSVWLGSGCGAPLAESVQRVEAFYRARGLVPMFQVTPGQENEALDAYLEARGYWVDTPVAVRVADAQEVLAAVPNSEPGSPSPVEVDVASPREDRFKNAFEDLFQAWFEISGRQGHYGAVADIYRALLARLGDRARFALARYHGVPAAVGLMVTGERWNGIFAMQTLPAYRRRGLGAAILRALAAQMLAEAEAGATRASRLYLQVERGNVAAEHLYGACTFRERYGYHYRVGPVPRDA